MVWDLSVLEVQADKEMDDAVHDSSLQAKRKIKNQAEWKREKRKRSIIAGQSHYSVKGEFVSPKKIGSDCKCKLKCYEKIDSGLRQTLFEGFYSLRSYDEQNAYLFGLIRKHEVKRKKNINSDRRTCTYKYYVRNEGKLIQICKIAFAHIHAVSFRKIRTLSEKLDQNVLFPRDGRGKHDNRPTKTPTGTLDLIKEHILQIIKTGEFKKFIKEDKNNLMTPELNVTKLYLHFLQTYEKGAVNLLTGQLNPGFSPKVKSWLYRKVFHQEVKCSGLQLKTKLNAETDKSSVEQDIININKTEDSKNSFLIDTKRLQRKATVLEQTFVSFCETELQPKSSFQLEKSNEAKNRKNEELNDLYFMTVNSNINDSICKDETQPFIKISLPVNNSVNIAEVDDLLNQRSDKLQSDYVCPNKSNEIYSPLQLPMNINDNTLTSNISAQSFVENVPICETKYKVNEQFDSNIKVFQPSGDKNQGAAISSLDNVHTFYL